MNWKKLIPKVGIFYLIAVFFGLWGYMVGGYHFFPYEQLHWRYVQLRAFLKGGENDDKTLLKRLTTHIQEKPNRFNYGGFILRDKDFIDSGYLLLSRFDCVRKQVVVELVRLRDFEIIHTWIPPVKTIIEKVKAQNPEKRVFLPSTFRAQHPLLFESGAIVFSHGEGCLVRIDKNSQLEWINTRHFHHAIEKDADGNLVVNTVIDDPDYKPIEGYRDDGFAIVSPIDGEILKEWSISSIMVENGYEGALLGYGQIDPGDLLHVNDAQPFLEDSGAFKKRDIILSMRNLSTIAVFRPSSNSLVMIKNGPWLNQHDVDVLPEGQISVFNNDIFRTEGDKYNLRNHISSIGIWNPETGAYNEPYNELLKKIEMHTYGGGLHRILPNNDAFIEEHYYSRLLRISNTKIRWEYVNTHPDNIGITGALHWCRYYEPDEIDLEWLDTE